MRQLLVLILGEIKLQLRQPLALGLMLLFPMLAGPGGLVGLEGMMAAVDSAESGETTVGEETVRQVIRIAAPAELAGWITAEDALEVAPDGALVPEGPVGDVLAEVELEDHEATVRFRADLPRSRAARDRVVAVLEREEHRRLAERLAEAGVETPLNQLVRIETRDVSVGGERSGDLLGVALAPLLLLTLVVAALYTAVDVVTGEKERGTIETLLTSRANRRAVVVAKMTVVILATAAAGWLLLASLFGAQLSGALALPTLLGGEADLLRHLPFLFVATTLLAVQLAGLMLVLATWVPDYKAASMVSGPAMLLLLLPAGIGALPVELGPLVALVPIANVALAIREQLSGQLGAGTLALVLGASAVHAAVAVGVALRLFGREAALLGTDESAARRRLGYYGRDAAVLYVVALLVMWFFGSTAQALDLIWGMVFTQIVLMGSLGVAAVAWLGLPLRETLSLRAPRPGDLLLACVAGLFAPFVGSLAFVLQDPWLPTSRSFIEQMLQITLDDYPLWVPLVLFALLPAVCEELLFRGALLGLLRRSLAQVPRVLVVALAFGLMHLSFTRLLPTAAIGLLVTIAVLRSGSLYTAVVIHFVNNALLLTIGRYVETDTHGSVGVYALGAAAGFAAVFAMGWNPRRDLKR